MFLAMDGSTDLVFLKLTPIKSLRSTFKLNFVETSDTSHLRASRGRAWEELLNTGSATAIRESVLFGHVLSVKSTLHRR